jgi:hypothetical protein
MELVEVVLWILQVGIADFLEHLLHACLPELLSILLYLHGSCRLACMHCMHLAYTQLCALLL